MSFRALLQRSVAGRRLVTTILVWLLMIAPAQSQIVVDGSDSTFDPSARALLLSVLKSRLLNPQTAQLRGIVQTQPGVYCGEVRIQGRNGEYGDFSRFVVETKIRQATIIPTSDPARTAMILRMIEDRCHRLDGGLR